MIFLQWLDDCLVDYPMYGEALKLVRQLAEPIQEKRNECVVRRKGFAENCRPDRSGSIGGRGYSGRHGAIPRAPSSGSARRNGYRLRGSTLRRRPTQTDSRGRRREEFGSSIQSTTGA
jgi:hypothetical protein